jgi:4'-phosphopantetheinyl transferase
MLEPLSLPENEIHLWCCFSSEITDPALLMRYYPLMNADETAQQKRFHFERHRHQYLITRAMIRTLLARYTGIPAKDLVFQKNEYGRPELIPEQRKLPIHFNLSHTDGLIACGVVLKREIGVDVEDITRGGDLVKIADRFFSPMEVHDLNTVEESRQEARFFDYWTLKESYIKARGMGLSIPLDQFGFIVNDQDKSIEIEIDSRQNDLPTRWQFRQWRKQDFKVALTVEREPTVDCPVVIRGLVPMFSDGDAGLTEFRRSTVWPC